MPCHDQGDNKKTKQSRRYEKIHVIRQFFEASVPQVFFSKKKKKNPFLDKVYWNMCTNCQVCIFFRLVRRRDTNEYINTYTHIQVKVGISLTGCLPHVDFNEQWAGIHKSEHLETAWAQAQNPKITYFSYEQKTALSGRSGKAMTSKWVHTRIQLSSAIFTTSLFFSIWLFPMVI